MFFNGAVPAISRSLRFYAEAKQQILSPSGSYVSVAMFSNLVYIILSSVQWARQYDDLYLVNAIGQATAFFTDNRDGKPFYAFWSSEVVLNEAEELRKGAWKIAMDAPTSERVVETGNVQSQG